MDKKNLIFLSVLLLVITAFSGIVYANENTMANDIKNGINDAGATVVDGAERLGNDVRNGIGSVENGIEDALTMNDNNRNEDRNTSMGTAAGNYTATRVSSAEDSATSALAGTDNSTMWVWLIIAVAAVIIVALIWYYATQETTTNNRNHDDE